MKYLVFLCIILMLVVNAGATDPKDILCEGVYTSCTQCGEEFIKQEELIQVQKDYISILQAKIAIIARDQQIVNRAVILEKRLQKLEEELKQMEEQT